MRLIISSYLILSHLISSYLILSHLISSHLLSSYLILSHLISSLSHLMSSYLISSHLISSYLILSLLISSYFHLYLILFLSLPHLPLLDTRSRAHHDFQLQSSYQDPAWHRGVALSECPIRTPIRARCTSFHARFQGTVDYIWFTPTPFTTPGGRGESSESGLEVSHIYELPDDASMMQAARDWGGLPNVKQASDHFSLAVKFRWR
eukprot:g6603.t1